MSQRVKAQVQRAADKAVGVNKAFGCGPDKRALVKMWLPVAEALDKASRKLEKTVNKLEASVEANRQTSEYITSVNEKMLAVDSMVLATVEKTVNPTEHDINTRVQGVIQRNMGGRHPFVLIPPNVINLN